MRLRVAAFLTGYALELSESARGAQSEPKGARVPEPGDSHQDEMRARVGRALDFGVVKFDALCAIAGGRRSIASRIVREEREKRGLKVRVKVPIS
jgi:hypothetical protein